jgi:hypothetical protein
MTTRKLLLSTSTLMLLSLAPCVAFADIKRHAFVPEEFWGNWAENADGCRHADKTYIAIAAKSYVTADVACSVDWVAETAVLRGAMYSARLRCSTPGGPVTASNVLLRREDIGHILAGPGFSKLKTYGRCGATEPVVAK